MGGLGEKGGNKKLTTSFVSLLFSSRVCNWINFLSSCNDYHHQSQQTMQFFFLLLFFLLHTLTSITFALLPDCDSINYLLSVRLNDHQHRYSSNNNNDIENSLLSDSKGSIMNSNHHHDYLSGSSHVDNGSGKFSTALNRLKYGYDYKPLMRTFTRRFDSPTKVLFILPSLSFSLSLAILN